MVSQRDIVEAQTKLLHEPSTSDLTVKCGAREWKCQSAILAQRCDFFKVVCNGPFQESETRVINLSGDVGDAVECLLLYLYTLTLPKLDGNATTAENAYIMGDKYGISELRDAGKRCLMDSITSGLGRFNGGDEHTKKNWIGWVKRSWPRETEGSAEIREAIVKSILIQSELVVSHPDFDGLLLSNEGFRTTFLQALAKKAAGRS